MEITEAICTRRSIRSFKPDPVPKKVLEELLDACRWAPSGGNVQPWYFAILGGKVLDEVKARLEEKVRTSWDGNDFVNTNPDFPRIGPYPEFFEQRHQAWRERHYSYLFPPGTERLEEKKLEYVAKGQRFFDAPNVIIIYTENDASPIAIMAIGIMSQTICLAALAYGLGTCIMGRPVFWPGIYRERLGIPEDKLIATAIAIGYPALEAIANTYPRLREPLDAMAHWHGV